MSNAVPQLPQLNGGPWTQLEGQVRDYAQLLGEIWVATGSIYERPVSVLESSFDANAGIMWKPIQTATSFYKILIDGAEGCPRVLAFLIPHAPVGGSLIEDSLVSIDHFEVLVCLNFLPRRECEQGRIKSEVATDLWRSPWHPAPR